MTEQDPTAASLNSLDNISNNSINRMAFIKLREDRKDGEDFPEAIAGDEGPPGSGAQATDNGTPEPRRYQAGCRVPRPAGKF